MNATHLLDGPLLEAALQLRAGTVTPEALTEAAIERIQTDTEAQACFVRFQPEEALRQAKQSRPGDEASMLAGIPLAHKDVFSLRGKAITFCTDVSMHMRGRRTAPVLADLDNAGAVNLGGLHLAEFAMGAAGWNENWGFLPNPLDKERVSGGSSSGSAVAVARKLVFGSLGTDTGGSIRVPASFCGVVGVKPSNGLISLRGVFPVSSSLDTVGVLARSVRDCACILECISGKAFPLTHENAPGSRLHNIRVGILQPGALPSPPDPKAQEGVERVRRALHDHGYSFKYINTELPMQAHNLSGIVFLSEAGAVHMGHLQAGAEKLGPQVRNRLLLGLSFPASVYIRALQARRSILARLRADVLSKVDVLICPATPCLAPQREAYAGLRTDEAIAINGKLGSYTAWVNYLGMPAVAVPVRLDDGLPMGIQVIADAGKDALALQAADLIELLFSS